MAKKTLIYCWDEQTGRMRLHGGKLRLSEHDRMALESELRRQYESLLEQLDGGGSDAVITFQATVTEFRDISGFRIRYSGARQARCPDLVLEPISSRKAESRPRKTPDTAKPPENRGSTSARRAATPPTAPAAATRELAVPGLAPWFVGFLEDVQGRLSEKPRSHLTIDDCNAMRFILASLQELCCDKPEDLAVFLLAGYVSLGERMSQYADPDEARLYRSAAHVLERLCGWRISPGAEPVPAAPPVPPNETVSRLRRIMRYFGSAIGLREEEDWE